MAFGRVLNAISPNTLAPARAFRRVAAAWCIVATSLFGVNAASARPLVGLFEGPVDLNSPALAGGRTDLFEVSVMNERVRFAGYRPTLLELNERSRRLELERWAQDGYHQDYFPHATAVASMFRNLPVSVVKFLGLREAILLLIADRGSDVSLEADLGAYLDDVLWIMSKRGVRVAALTEPLDLESLRAVLESHAHRAVAHEHIDNFTTSIHRAIRDRIRSFVNLAFVQSVTSRARGEIGSAADERSVNGDFDIPNVIRVAPASELDADPNQRYRWWREHVDLFTATPPQSAVTLAELRDGSIGYVSFPARDHLAAVPRITAELAAALEHEPGRITRDTLRAFYAVATSGSHRTTPAPGSAAAWIERLRADACETDLSQPPEPRVSR